MNAPGGDPPIPRVAAEGDRPGAWADLPERSRRPVLSGRALLATLGVGGWAALGVGVVYYLGVGGWRLGWLAAATMGAGASAVAWIALGPRAAGRGLWVAAVAVVGVTMGIKLAEWAPESTARIDAQIDQMRIDYQLWQRVSEQRLGHGWCSPQCPEVRRVYRAPNNSDAGALALALAGLHRIGLVGDIRSAYNRQRGPDIIVGQHRHLHGSVDIAHVGGRVEMTIDLISER